MILKGSQRGGARQMAAHLLNAEDNEHVEVHEVRGFMSNHVTGALREIHAQSQGTRCEQFMFSMSLSPPAQESVPVAAFEQAVDEAEQRLGLAGQPRVLVFHEKEGRRHAHCVWSRINIDEMKAVNLSHYKLKLQDLSRQLYLVHGWEMPKGLQNQQERDPLNFTRAQWQQAKRAQEDPKALKALFQACWQTSDNKQAFENALKDKGYFLARGDRRGYVAVDCRGEVFALNRWTGVKTKELQQRLGDPNRLPDITATKQQMAGLMNERLRTHARNLTAQSRQAMETLKAEKQKLTEKHRAEREKLQAHHEKRCVAETQTRAQRFSTGLRGIWERITGKYQETRRQNEREAHACRTRDQEQRQALIDRQLAERRILQGRMLRVRAEHQAAVQEIKRDAAHYREMRSPEPLSLTRDFENKAKPSQRKLEPSSQEIARQKRPVLSR